MQYFQRRRLRVGHRNALTVVKLTQHGCYMDGYEAGEILLPARYVPKGCRPGDTLDLFVYHDSEDRLVCTTEQPLAEVGQFAALRCVATSAPGAFLDWGLQKDLLLPNREQRHQMAVGQVYVVFLYIDTVTGRIAATERFASQLDNTTPHYQTGDKATALVLERTDLGYNIIADDAFSGLLYHTDLYQPLEVGQRLDVWVKKVRDDLRIDFSPTPLGYNKVDALAQTILQRLTDNHGRLPYNDASAPDDIRREFACSKKAFKMTLGALLRQGCITLDHKGIRLIIED